MPPIDWNMCRNDFLTKKEKFYCTIIVLAIISVITFFFLSFTKEHEQLCTTPACFEASKFLLTYVDKSVDPCENFHGFTCGGFHENFAVRNMSDPIDSMNFMANKTIRRLVEKHDINEGNFTRSLLHQRKFYRACMDMSTIEADHDQTFLKILDEVTGGLSYFRYKSNIVPNWANVFINAKRKGLKHDFFFRVTTYENVSEQKAYVMIEPPVIEQHEINMWSAIKYHQNLLSFTKMSKIWTHDIMLDIDLDLPNTYIFASQALKGARAKLAKKNKTLNRVPMANFTREANFVSDDPLIGYVDWLPILRNMTGLDLNNSSLIVYNFDSLDYFAKLKELFRLTRSGFWLNYVSFGLIADACEYLSKPIRELCRLILNSPWQDMRRNDFCFNEANKWFPPTSYAEYIRQSLPKAKKAAIQEMVEYVKVAMEDHLRLEQRLTNKSIAKLIDYLKDSKVHIGWKDIVFNKTKFEELSGYKLDLSQNVLEARNQLRNLSLNNLIDNVRNWPTEYYGNLIEKLAVNEAKAFQFNKSNEIILTAPLLQNPIFELNRPAYLNYGSLAHIVGQEMMHIFKNYLLKNKEDPYFCATLFDHLCLEKAYQSYSDKYNLTKIELDLLIFDMMADFGGINLAYKAYNKWVKRHGAELQLPGLSYTPHQLFWISGSTNFCKKPDWFVKFPDDQLHPSFRVDAPKMDSPFFVADFGCDANSTMNIANKCAISAN